MVVQCGSRSHLLSVCRKYCVRISVSPERRSVAMPEIVVHARFYWMDLPFALAWLLPRRWTDTKSRPSKDWPRVNLYLLDCSNRFCATAPHSAESVHLACLCRLRHCWSA